MSRAKGLVESIDVLSAVDALLAEAKVLEEAPEAIRTWSAKFNMHIEAIKRAKSKLNAINDNMLIKSLDKAMADLYTASVHLRDHHTLK